MPENLSVLIPTFNEEENISACVESIGDLASQILIFDSFSSDRTVEIARSLGAEIRQRNFDDYASQKNEALRFLQQPWILILDADERLTRDLREEIHAILKNGAVFDGYRIRRETFFRNRKVRCWSRDWSLRLFRNGAGSYEPRKLVHERLVLNGKVSRLEHPLEHYTFRSFSQYLPKVDSFTSLAAEEAFARGERASLLTLLFYPPARFLKTYFLRQGFRDGIPGLLIAWLSAYSTYLRYAKIWELRSGNKNRNGFR